jgi:hypothetical protein
MANQMQQFINKEIKKADNLKLQELYQEFERIESDVGVLFGAKLFLEFLLNHE